jgi:aspartyl-tRNA(Asn)/glutamyl-tRNA(Gln) amidotransferase subunit C
MGISLEEARKIASLARLEFSDLELEDYREHLSEILSYVCKLNEIDTDDIEPTWLIRNDRIAMREDEVQASIPVDSVMMNAPSHKNGFFCVPKVIQPLGSKP